jgi:predicted RNA-binding Zn-ribbon protein involved in translation (DUF1610 family)
MTDPCIGCGKTDGHPFEGLVQGRDGQTYDGRCEPTLQHIHAVCEACEWRIRYRVIPQYCPQCGTPTRLVSPDSRL